MAVDYTTTQIIANIKRRYTVPNSQPLYLPANIVQAISEELEQMITPFVMERFAEYFVTNYDITPAQNQTTFDIPPRAVGGKLRDCVLVSSNGLEQGIPYINPDTLKEDYPIITPVLFGFFIRDNKIVVYPGTYNLSAVTLRLKYFRRPNRCVLVSQAGRITNIDTVTNVVTLSNPVTAWTTATQFDITKGTPTFSTIKDNQTISAIAGNNLTFTSLPEGMEVGDWVAEAGESPIPQIPFELFGLLEQSTIMQMAESLKDIKGLQASAERYKMLEDKAIAMMQPRVDGSPERLNARNGIFRAIKVPRGGRLL